MANVNIGSYQRKTAGGKTVTVSRYKRKEDTTPSEVKNPRGIRPLKKTEDKTDFTNLIPGEQQMNLPEGRKFSHQKFEKLFPQKAKQVMQMQQEISKKVADLLTGR